MKPALLFIAAISGPCGWAVAPVFHHPAGSPAASGRKILLYQSPMHPWVTSDKPGQCTTCGMDLAPINDGGRKFDAAATDIVMLPEGSPNVSACRRTRTGAQR